LADLKFLLSLSYPPALEDLIKVFTAGLILLTYGGDYDPFFCSLFLKGDDPYIVAGVEVCLV
jgi:hypothetical protein